MNLFNCHTAAWQKKFLTFLGTDHLTYMGRKGVKLFLLEPDKFSQMKLIQIIPYVDTCKICNFFSSNFTTISHWQLQVHIIYLLHLSSQLIFFYKKRNLKKNSPHIPLTLNGHSLKSHINKHNLLFIKLWLRVLKEGLNMKTFKGRAEIKILQWKIWINIF